MEINEGGFLVGILVWISLVVFMSFESSCAEFKSCGSGDLIIFALIALGFGAPAYFSAAIATIFLKKPE